MFFMRPVGHSSANNACDKPNNCSNWRSEYAQYQKDQMNISTNRRWINCECFPNKWTKETKG